MSVLNDFYLETIQNEKDYHDIKWFFLTSIPLKETNNVKIINCKKAIKSWGHRIWFNFITAKKILRKNKIDAVVSLQNMGILGYKGISIISLHNVLPLYKCDETVLDGKILRIKQHILNSQIIYSLRHATGIMVPSKWIRARLEKQFNLNRNKIFINPLSIPEIMEDTKKKENQNIIDEGKTVFFYPAKSFPYKNHKVLIDACKILKMNNVYNYKVIFTFDINQSKTSKKLFQIVKKYNLPVEFVGVLPREEVLELYTSATLLFPSKIETDAMPILECIKMGGSVISADLPYATEALAGYPNKKYCDNSLPKEWAKAMNSIIMKTIEYDNNDSKKDIGYSSISRLCTIIDIIRSEL